MLLARTNLLGQALSHFDRVVSEFPQSVLVGKAWNNRGWCLWNQGLLAGSLAAFKEAATRLPPSEDQARARFKWADVQFQLKDFSGAISNYQRLILERAKLPELPATLVEQAHYQIVRAGIELGELGGLAQARAAAQRILLDHPDSQYADRCLLLFGQALSGQQQTNEARAVLADLLLRFPASPLFPEAQLAVARTYAQAQDYPTAIGKLEEWLSHFPEHGSRPQVEFDRAWLQDQAGNQTNALNLFTNIVTQFATHAVAEPLQDTSEQAKSDVQRGEAGRA